VLDLSRVPTPLRGAEEANFFILPLILGHESVEIEGKPRQDSQVSSFLRVLTRFYRLSTYPGVRGGLEDTRNREGFLSLLSGAIQGMGLRFEILLQLDLQSCGPLHLRA